MRRKKHVKNTGRQISEVIEEVPQEKDVAVAMSKSKCDEPLTPSDSLLDFFKSAPCEFLDLEVERSLDLPRQFDI